MPNALLRRTALIALALVLASCVSAHAQNPPAQPAPDPALAQANAFIDRQPDAIMCAVAPAGAGRQKLNTPHDWIPVPAGKKPTDICPEAKITDSLYNNPPGVIYHLPWAPAGSPLPIWPKDAGGGH